MKKFILIIITLSLFSCKTENKQVQVLTDSEWSDILISTLPLAKGDRPYIYREYGNEELKDITSKVYVNCADIGYELNDSIISNINNRKNIPITNKIDTMYNISLVSDLNEFKHNYVIYSEPFYVSTQILCVSMGNKLIVEDEILQWVFFLEKQNGSFKIIEFYDVQKDKFFKPASL